MKGTLRLVTLFAIVISAVSAMGQTQGNFAASAQKAIATAPGFIYKATLSSLKKPKWQFEIAGADGMNHRIQVDAVTGSVLQNKISKLDKKAPLGAPIDVVSAGLNAVAEVGEEFAENTQVMKVEVKNTKTGLRWKIQLKSLEAGDDKDNHDFDVVEDEDGEILDIIEDAG